MRRTIFLLFLLASGSMGLALDFTPRYYENTFPNGASLKKLYFADGNKKYTVNLDHDIEVSGDKGETLFRYRSLEGATFTLRGSPNSLSFDADGLDACRKMAESFAPSGSMAGGEWEELPNSIQRSNWQSYRFTRTYRLPGSTIRQSVAFVNAGQKHQFILVTTAFTAQFKEAAERTEEIARSWRELTDEDLSAPSFN